MRKHTVRQQNRILPGESGKARRNRMKDKNAIPTGDQIFESHDSLDVQDEELDPLVRLAAEVKPTGGRDARNKKKE